MAALGLIVGVLGSAVSAAGAIRQGQAEKQAADYNAIAAKQQAAAAQDAANAQAEDFKRQGSRQLASSFAARGASGITQAGSPLMVDEATVKEIALGAARYSYSGLLQKNRFLDQAHLYKIQGRNAQTASYFNAGSSLLAGFGSAYGNYAQANPGGAGGYY